MKKGALMAVCVVVIPAIVSAGLVIKEKTSTTGVMRMWSSEGTETSYLEGDKMRTESQIKTTGMMASMTGQGVKPSVMIIRLDKDVIWQLNQDDSTYVEASLMPEDIGEEAEVPDFKVRDINVEKTGEKREIAEHKCEGVDVAMTFEVMQEGKMREHRMNMLLWMSSKTKGLEDLRKFWERMSERSRDLQTGFPVGDVMGELWDKVKEIEGVPLGMEMTIEMPSMDEEEDEEMREAMKMMRQYMKGEEGAEEAEETPGNQIKIVSEVLSVEQQELDQALFEIPEGYTKTEQMQPMMPKMRGP